MDFSLTPEQTALVETARQFAAEKLAPYAGEWDQRFIFPLETYREAAKLGFASIYVQEKWGGSQLSRLDAALIFEQLAMGCISTAAFLTVHNMVSRVVQEYGGDALQKRYLPKLAPMEWLGSYCLTEPEYGSDAASLQTKAVKKGDRYIINGTKAFISGGGVSDLYIVMARTGGPGAEGISAILVEKNTKGVSFGKPEHKMGWRSQPTTTVSFDNAEVPAENLLSKEGEGFKIAMKALDGGRVNIASCSLGGAQACMNLSKDYLTARKQFGKELREFQALQFKYADMATELEAARLLTYRAAAALDKDDQNASLYAAMAKRFASDAAFAIADAAMQLHGGYGYIREYQVERYFRDLRVHQILEGTNEIMRLVIARKSLY
ncbi:MAG: acyl-CoA dehydrogenase family protein [Dongiaceae bacterium]